MMAMISSADNNKDGAHKSQTKKDVIDTNQIIWHNYDEGLKLAVKTERPIMVNFTTTWCGYCKKMNRTTFIDSEIVNILNNDFVSIKVDGDSQTELNIDGYKITERNLTRSEYGVRGYPTYWFLKSNAERIGPISGYKAADPFLDVLYYVRDEVYDKMKFDEYMKNGGRKGNY